MSKRPKEIKKALLYLSRGEYSSVIRLLEPKIPLFLENRDFYTILAKAFFYTGDYAGAKLYFDRGQKIHWQIESALYLAVLGLKRRDFNSSLRIWLDILDEDPGNKMAKKGLATLKKYSTMDELEHFIHSKKVDRLTPRKPIKLALSTTITLVLVGFIISGTVIFLKTDLFNRFVEGLFSDKVVLEDRSGVEEFKLKDFDKDYLDFSNRSIYSFTGAQIEEYFEIAHDLFLQKRDTRVRTYLNLIKYSNAREGIKLKAEKLDSYLVDPNWANYNEVITFKDVENSMYQYENCVVKWKGLISNYEIVDKKIHFTLLVGYDRKKVLEGIVQVELNQNVKIQDNQPIEVLGKVTLRDNQFYLEALTVMQYIVEG